MATNVYFDVLNRNQSKLTLTPYEGPYISGSLVAYTGPVSGYVNSGGIIQFNHVIAGIYKVAITNTNLINSVNYSPTIFYVNLPDSSGSLVRGNDYIITKSI